MAEFLLYTRNHVSVFFLSNTKFPLWFWGGLLFWKLAVDLPVALLSLGGVPMCELFCFSDLGIPGFSGERSSAAHLQVSKRRHQCQEEAARSVRIWMNGMSGHVVTSILREHSFPRAIWSSSCLSLLNVVISSHLNFVRFSILLWCRHLLEHACFFVLKPSLWPNSRGCPSWHYHCSPWWMWGCFSLVLGPPRSLRKRAVSNSIFAFYIVHLTRPW